MLEGRLRNGAMQAFPKKKCMTKHKEMPVEMSENIFRKAALLGKHKRLGIVLKKVPVRAVFLERKQI